MFLFMFIVENLKCVYIISERCHGPRSALHAPRGPLRYTGLLSIKRIGPQTTTDWNSGEWCIANCKAVTYNVTQQYRCIQ
jgi:hypothetical protein